MPGTSGAVSVTVRVNAIADVGLCGLRLPGLIHVELLGGDEPCKVLGSGWHTGLDLQRRRDQTMLDRFLAETRRGLKPDGEWWHLSHTRSHDEEGELMLLNRIALAVDLLGSRAQDDLRSA